MAGNSCSHIKTLVIPYTDYTTGLALHTLIEKSQHLECFQLGSRTAINTDLLLILVNMPVLKKLILDNVPQFSAAEFDTSAAASSDSSVELSRFFTYISKTSLAPLLHATPKLKQVNVTIAKHAEENIDALYRPIAKTPTPSLTSGTWSTPASVFWLEIPFPGWISSHRTPSFHAYHLNSSSPPRISNKWPLVCCRRVS